MTECVKSVPQTTMLPPFLQAERGVACWLRRLLRVDVPIPPRTEEELAAEVERNYRWNFWFNLLDGVSFWLAMSFASTSTIMPLFVSKLTSSRLAIGLLGVLAQGGWFLPQLLTANVVEQLPRKKEVVANLGFYLERIPYWLMVPAAILALWSPTLAVVLFLLGYGGHVLGAGIVAPAWQDLLARCFPPRRRGRLFGLVNFLGAAGGMACAALSSHILGALPFPWNFALIFALASFFIALSWIAIAQVREPVRPITQPYRRQRDYWPRLWRILRRDHNFRRFLITRVTIALAGMGTSFLTVAALKRWQIDDEMVGLYTGASMIGLTLGNILFGFVADRAGHKLPMLLGAALAAVAFAVAWLAPSPDWYYLTFALLGGYQGASMVSGILMVLEFAPPGRTPTYVGLTNTAIDITGIAAPLLATALTALGYATLFAVSATVSLVGAVLMGVWVRDPRRLSRQSRA